MISTVILTKNAESSIEKCLASVAWSDEILVVDDISTDKTISIAKKCGAKVITHSLENDFAKQRNFALQHTKNGWVFFLDSDEIVTKELAKEIQHAVSQNVYDGFFIKRRDVMWKKEILHGENGSQWIIRIAKKQAGKWEGKVHEIWQVQKGVGKLENILYHYPHPTVGEFLQEINTYSTLRAQELYEKGIITHWWDIIFYPKAKFVQNYIVKRGFLDGTIGLVLALIMSMHSFLVRGKLWQLQKNK